MKILTEQCADYRMKILLIAVLSLLCIAFAGNVSAELTAKANHDHIKIDFFYHGSTMSVRGVSDPDAGDTLTLSATLCFEQSYGMVEGDSASSTELFALLSAVARVPINQPIIFQSKPR